MKKSKDTLSRRQLLKGAAALTTAVAIFPQTFLRRVVGAKGVGSSTETLTTRGIGAMAQNTSTRSVEEELERSLARLNEAITDTPSRLHHERAEVLFRLERFPEAIQDYDEAARFGWPHDENSCWERGLAQYYAGQFRAGAEQFERYHRVGALDIENGLWRFLCIAEEEDIAKARETMTKYPRQVRPPFPALLDLYLGRGTVEAVLDQATGAATTHDERTTNLFNAHYYLGKYYEIVGQQDRALTHVQKALGHRIPHFMYACAEIDAKRLAA